MMPQCPCVTLNETIDITGQKMLSKNMKSRQTISGERPGLFYVLVSRLNVVKPLKFQKMWSDCVHFHCFPIGNNEQ